MRLRKRHLLWMVPLGLVLAVGVYFFWPLKTTYSISPETTYVTEPLTPEGHVDYPKALSDRLSKEIAPERNANVLILKALGPKPEGATMPPGYFEALGMEKPPEQGDYFIPWRKFIEPKRPAETERQEWEKKQYDRLDAASKRPWKAEEYPEIVQWLQQNEKPLALIAEASRREKYFNPLLSKSTSAHDTRLISGLLSSTQICREVVQALKCRAMLKMASGKEDSAWQDLMVGRRLGALMFQSVNIIESLVACALIAVSTDGQVTLLNQPHSAKQLQSWLKELQTLPALPSLERKFDLGERYSALDAFQSVALGGGENLKEKEDDDLSLEQYLPRHRIQYDQAFRNVNHFYDRLRDLAKLPDRAGRKAALKEMENDYSDQKFREAHSSSRPFRSSTEIGTTIGDILLGLSLSAHVKIFEAADRTAQIQQNLLLAYALAAYRADKGSYPARLDDLAPSYLPKIPNDRFTGQPLIYKPSPGGFLLYSVGVNEKDDGGIGTDDEPKGDDLRIRIPIPLRPAKEER